MTYEVFWEESRGKEDFNAFMSPTDTYSTTVTVRRDSGRDREEELRDVLLTNEEEDEEGEEEDEEEEEEEVVCIAMPSPVTAAITSSVCRYHFTIQKSVNNGIVFVKSMSKF